MCKLLLETWMPADYQAMISKTIDSLEKLHEYCIRDIFQPYDSVLVFTAPKVYPSELGYAMKAHGSFNNGNAPVSKILSALGKMANVDQTVLPVPFSRSSPAGWDKPNTGIL